MKRHKFTILVLLLVIPSFSFLLQMGIYSMHDPHLFRQYEFSHCLAFPCRWAPDSGLGYGEPLFNFYGQFPYWLGHLFYLSGFSILASVKGVFLVSLVGSALAMWLLARSIYPRSSALISSIFYIYAPYRAVDVYVRGNLNEATALAFLPLLLFFSRRYLQYSSPIALIIFSVVLALLLITHNLSFIMFFPFLLMWIILNIRVFHRSFRVLAKFMWSGLLAGLLAAFYLLPVIVESSLVTLATTTEGYFNYQLHFATLWELFISRFWGYGASLWGPQDDLSLSVGHLHWLIPALIGPVLLLAHSQVPRQTKIYFWFFSICGLAAIFLTHGKSLIIWKLVPFLSFIQFPWRFLEISILFLALAAGVVAQFFPARQIVPIVISLCLVVSGPYFTSANWRYLTDRQYFSGAYWAEQKATSLKDYWPSTSQNFPSSPAPDLPDFVTGIGQVLSHSKLGHTAKYTIHIDSAQSQVVFPIVNFPRWQVFSGPRLVSASSYGPLGLISAVIPHGTHDIRLVLANTPARSLGNLISLISLIGLIGSIVYVQTRSHFFH